MRHVVYNVVPIQRVHRDASHQLRQQVAQRGGAVEQVEADDASVDEEERAALTLDRQK